MTTMFGNFKKLGQSQARTVFSPSGMIGSFGKMPIEEPKVNGKIVSPPSGMIVPGMAGSRMAARVSHQVVR